MQSLKLVSAFVCAASTAALLASAADYGSPPTWRHEFQAAEADAKRLNRPLLVHFHAKWCGPCQVMNREVLSDPSVLRQLDAAVVAVKVDSDERPDLVQRFGIQSLPTDIFLDPSGFVLDRSSGMTDRERYLSLIARVDARFVQSHEDADRAADQTHLARAGFALAGDSTADRSESDSPSSPGAAADRRNHGAGRWAVGAVEACVWRSACTGSARSRWWATTNGCGEAIALRGSTRGPPTT